MIVLDKPYHCLNTLTSLIERNIFFMQDFPFNLGKSFLDKYGGKTFLDNFAPISVQLKGIVGQKSQSETTCIV